ncbi:unnamed protein product [Prorocentrum cordatum]|uniref:Uncharacterized protein n=1 Tax=Prorocentrum cordatum TaxID=2364126 RepID=A0ABN9U6I5_9DINO|nr:unnamed protein product [Polarella glacialis]
MGSPLVGRLKTQLSRLAGDPEGLYVTAENLKRLLRQLDPSSAIISDEGFNVFASVTPKESNGQISVGTIVDWLYEDSDFGLPEMQEKSPSTMCSGAITRLRRSRELAARCWRGCCPRTPRRSTRKP